MFFSIAALTSSMLQLATHLCVSILFLDIFIFVSHDRLVVVFFLFVEVVVVVVVNRTNSAISGIVVVFRRNCRGISIGSSFNRIYSAFSGNFVRLTKVARGVPSRRLIHVS